MGIVPFLTEGARLGSDPSNIHLGSVEKGGSILDEIGLIVSGLGANLGNEWAGARRGDDTQYGSFNRNTQRDRQRFPTR